MNEMQTPDNFWSKMHSAYQRVKDRYSDIHAESNGNRLMAADLLWKQTRHDSALREDLIKTACGLISLTLQGLHGDTVPQLPGCRGPKSKFEKDPELAAFVKERLGKMPLREISEQAKRKFGKRRAPGKSAIHSYWQRQLKKQSGPT
jgi:hypothetical protein